MNLSTSFMSVLALIVGVGIAAFVIIWATEDMCPITSKRCEEDGKCISKRRFCNRIQDCANGSDEAWRDCADLIGVLETLQLMGIGDAGNDSIDLPTEIPEIDVGNMEIPDGCEAYNHSKGSGTWCEMLAWNQIPWGQIDRRTPSLHLVEVIQTKFLEPPTFISDPDSTMNIKRLYMNNNTIEVFQERSLCHLPSLGKLDLTNNSIQYFGPNAFCQMNSLTWLILSKNNLKLRHFRFQGMPNLTMLDLPENAIEEISDHLFRDLTSLRILNLRGNLIRYIGGRAFRYNLELLDLNLSHNQIQHFEPHTFVGQSKLESLDIGFNKLTRLSDTLFINLGELRALHLNDTEIEAIDVTLFRHTPKLDIVFFKKFQYCKYIPTASRCYPASDGLSSMENLLVSYPLRWVVWIVGVLTVIANIAIMITRARPTRPRRRITVVDILVNNLAAADFLMGVYLIILAIKDIEYRNSYIFHAYEWSTSYLCSAIGVMAMISSEVSILILTLMSLERYIVISRPFSQRFKLSRTQAKICVIIIWIFGIGLALAPMGKISFYGSSGLCFPMHLDDPFEYGWQYTTFVFNGLNSICLILITVAYISLFVEIRKSREINPSQRDAKDMEVAIRLFFTVCTDFVCWAPIIVLKSLVIGGYPLPKELISWALIFLLPLNSAINPFLFTFSTGQVRLKLLSYFKIFPINNAPPDNFERIPLEQGLQVQSTTLLPSQQSVQVEARQE